MLLLYLTAGFYAKVSGHTLHSTMLLLYQYVSSAHWKIRFTLHSTMLLLYRSLLHSWRYPGWSLHSTMLLLYHFHIWTAVENGCLYIPLCFYYIKFTEKYVASGLYLYIPLCFYYIRILILIIRACITLHSTMLLLYPKSSLAYIEFPHDFTFHYASTISFFAVRLPSLPAPFTFHYASTISCITAKHNLL